MPNRRVSSRVPRLRRRVQRRLAVNATYGTFSAQLGVVAGGAVALHFNSHLAPRRGVQGAQPSDGAAAAAMCRSCHGWSAVAGCQAGWLPGCGVTLTVTT